jgi:hypothetical protein
MCGVLSAYQIGVVAGFLQSSLSVSHSVYEVSADFALAFFFCVGVLHPSRRITRKPEAAAGKKMAAIEIGGVQSRLGSALSFPAKAKLRSRAGRAT